MKTTKIVLGVAFFVLVTIGCCLYGTYSVPVGKAPAELPR